jgi:hypothetical protein
MTGLVASIAASIVAGLVEFLLSGLHVSETTGFVVSFIVWSVAFVPLYVWIKRLREGL